MVTHERVLLAVVVDMGNRQEHGASRLGWAPQGGDHRSTGRLSWRGACVVKLAKAGLRQSVVWVLPR